MPKSLFDRLLSLSRLGVARKNQRLVQRASLPDWVRSRCSDLDAYAVVTRTQSAKTNAHDQKQLSSLPSSLFAQKSRTFQSLAPAPFISITLPFCPLPSALLPRSVILSCPLPGPSPPSPSATKAPRAAWASSSPRPPIKTFTSCSSHATEPTLCVLRKAPPPSPLPPPHTPSLPPTFCSPPAPPSQDALPFFPVEAAPKDAGFFSEMGLPGNGGGRASLPMFAFKEEVMINFTTICEMCEQVCTTCTSGDRDSSMHSLHWRLTLTLEGDDQPHLLNSPFDSAQDVRREFNLSTDTWCGQIEPVRGLDRWP